MMQRVTSMSTVPEKMSKYRMTGGIKKQETFITFATFVAIEVYFTNKNTN